MGIIINRDKDKFAQKEDRQKGFAKDLVLEHSKKSLLDHPDASVTDEKIGERNVKNPDLLSGNIRLKLTDILNKIVDVLRYHKYDKANPHAVTKEQIGLGNVQNVNPASQEDLANHQTGGFLPHSASAVKYKDTTVEAAITTLENRGPAGGGSGGGGIFTVTVATLNSRNAANADFVCNGTNDQTVIMQAIAAVPASGGVVAFAEGDYYIPNEIMVANRDNVHLLGNGSRIFATASSAFLFQDCTHCKLENFFISTKNMSQMNIQGVRIIRGEGMRICRNTIDLYTKSGFAIYSYGAVNMLIYENNISITCATENATTINLAGQADECMIFNNIISPNAFGGKGTGIMFEGNRCSIKQNYITCGYSATACGIEIQANSGQNLVVENYIHDGTFENKSQLQNYFSWNASQENWNVLGG